MEKNTLKNWSNFGERTLKGIRKLPPLSWVVLFIIVFFSIAAPGFFQISNFINVIKQGSFLWMLATVATMELIAGGTDLSLGSIMTFSGVVMALLLKSEVPAFIAAMLGILSGAAVGVINGFVVSVIGIPAFIATLGTMNVFGGLALFLTGASAVYVGNPKMVFWGAGAIAGIPMPIIIAVVVFGISYVLLHHTPFGRYLVALGGNSSGALLSGVKTKKNSWLIFIYAGLIAGLTGVILASRLQSADPIVGVGWEFDAIAASIMGGTLGASSKGKGNITTTIIGVALISFLRNGLNIFGIPAIWQSAVVGSFLLFAIVFDVSMRRREKNYEPQS